MKGFLNFIREQGVVGLAVGFVLGGSVAKVVSSLVNDIINPLLSIVLGATDRFEALSLQIGSIHIKWGSFVSVLLDFLIIAIVVYSAVKLLKLDKLDRKKK
ncbi:MAG: large conductance mechanosensitive channel protein MscL [Patescibacteria group bacterium]